MSPSDLLRKSGVKRKVSSKSFSSRKKVKVLHHSVDKLPWRTVSRPSEAGIGGDDGILELEEVEGVEVIYETTEGGRVVKFNVVNDAESEANEEIEEPEDQPEDPTNTTDDLEEPVVVEDLPPFDSENLLPKWHKYPLHPKIKIALREKGFLTPTAIQAASLPFSMADRDVVGIAQTGSGKTLAYGLPILHHLLSQPRPSSSRKRPLRALVLAPTRELALQVSSHLNSLLTSIEFSGNAKTSDVEDASKSGSSSQATAVTKPPPHVSIAAIVGGMSAQKQRRVLDRGVDVLVATPGRLWDILEDDDELALEIRNLRFLVLDEADRMIEAGHFAELENILRLTLQEAQDEPILDDFEEKVAGQKETEEETKEGVKDTLQTFVFSATLSKDLQRNVKKKFRPKGNKKHYKRDQTPATTLDDLLLRLDFRDPNPEVIDLSPVGGIVSTLQEGKIECLSGDKDVYLYYFLLRYPGKSLVFLSSIDGIRRLMPLVELLNINAYPLHSQLEQRQRLKNLDRFTNTPNSVLLATDIAARGLDIPAVDHVIHFQIPRSADTYIHRNGRTARAMRKGFSMLMVAPDERRVVKALLGNIGRDEADIPEMTIELSMLDKLKLRVQLARKIENAQHKIKKTNHDRNWMRETAEVLGVDLDSDFVSESDDEDKLSNKKRKAKDQQMAAMKAELKQLLAQPLIANGVSTRYITSGSRPIVDDLLAGELNETMVGLKKAEAGSEMAIMQKKKKTKRPISAVKKVEEEEEWTVLIYQIRSNFKLLTLAWPIVFLVVIERWLCKKKMKANYKFSNICGTVYRQGNILFTRDGNSLYSPVGNRVSVFDLVNNKSFTFAFENRKNIASIALSPDGNVLISVDEDGRALLVNARKGVVLHHFNLHKPVKDVQFSPDGRYIAVTHGAHIQVWRTPNHLLREFSPFTLHRTYTGHHDDVLSIQWSPDSQCFITTSRDMTARLFTLNPVEGFRPKTFAGHKDAVLGAYFSADGHTIYTVSRDGAVFTWKAKETSDDENSDAENAPAASTSNGISRDIVNRIANTRWGVHKRHYFNQPGTKVVCSTFHAASDLLVVGFSTGVFGLWEMPGFTNIHTLSISQEKISSVAISPSGEWLAFGARKLGQLLVWEWQSESYVLKQQGHYFDMNTLAYASDGQTIATGGDDGKVKVWSTYSGFCFVTFTEHSAPISSVAFAKQGNVLFSASLDGTVRAYDLIRYRNFRTFTSPSPVQFSCLAVDPSGEVVAAGSTDSYEVFLWSVQTGKLLDVMAGHTGPVSSLAFSPSGANQLASGSWDKTMRVWNIFGRSGAVEPFSLNSDILALAFRPDGKEVAVSTLDGQITFFDIQESKQVNVIDGRKDVSGGRKLDDRVSAANNASGKSYNSLAYTADGRCLLAGGNSKYVVLYDVREGEGVMVKKFQISENLSLDGTEEFLDSRRINDAGINVDLIDDRDGSDLEDRMDTSLPGASRGAGDMSIRRFRREARTKCVRFSPTGRAWAAASTEGLLIYSLDETVTFDPFDLTIDLTPQSLLEVLADHEYLKAIVMAFRLNEKALIQRVYETIPLGDIRLIARQLPVIYVPLLLRFVGEHLDKSPHLEFDLVWVNTLLMAHGRLLRDRSGEFASIFRVLQKGLGDFESSISKLCEENTSTLSYLIDQSKVNQAKDVEMASA